MIEHQKKKRPSKFVRRVSKRIDKLNKRIDKNKYDIVFIMAILYITGIASGINMFHYPSYFDDEGVYMVRSIALAYHHTFSPYNYWYDHAPGGSIIIAIWLRLTGGVNTFGEAINSGRVLMLIINLFNALLLYLIARQYKLKKAFIAVIFLFFSLSPLVITLHRMVLLDNMMILALLLSLYIIRRTKNIFVGAFAGMLFGAALIIKESALYFIPGILILLYQKRPFSHRKFITISWITGLVITAITYPYVAYLKGELFPEHWILGLGGDKPHVSLISSIVWQNSRKGGDFYSRNSQFYYSFFHSWLNTDPFFMVLGTLATLYLLIICYRKRQYLPLVVMTVGYIYYLMRGGIVSDLYLIPLIPFFALNIGLALSEIYYSFKKSDLFKQYTIIFVVLIFASAIFWDVRNPDVYFVNATAPQLESINWLRNNTNKNDLTDIDSYAQADLLYTYGSTIYKGHGYQDFWELDQDPTLNAYIQDNWKNINYMLVTPFMIQNINGGGLPLSAKALKNSTVSEKYYIIPPNTGFEGILYRNSLHKQIHIAEVQYVEIKKVK